MRTDRWDRATADLVPPFAVVDLEAFDANAADLVRRAGGHPIRVASKSVRCRHLQSRALATPGFAGVMGYAVREAIWLVREGFADVFVAYPSVDLPALAEVTRDAELSREITVAIDSLEHVELYARVATSAAHPLRVAIDVDASLRVGRVHLGVRRSPVRTAAQAATVARAAARAGLLVDGLMFYDAQIAGVPDDNAAVRVMKRRSHAQLLERRSEICAAIGAETPLRFVNGGGTGSLHVTRQDPAVTELAAGSGLYGPALFDGYDDFAPRPAMAFALPVVRRPAPGIVTLFSGGYIASGPVGRSRMPSVLAPHGLSYVGTEGAGEVQTPLTGPAADTLRVGDRVWLRHAKAGEACERFTELHLVCGDEIVETVPTYRGEGKNFG
ncbi:amino acid deaminase/aldolase [Nostocoides sp. F2B08]|uniref:amino acid deaminase/aldolase n=1 Tax=Nostocoides sp. F2B08 TaxID=2653936 RepID=UPI001D052764|nr:amino acid deaminase/aldolase [Tetrasphaera sp. F2B08]